MRSHAHKLMERETVAKNVFIHRFVRLHSFALFTNDIVSFIYSCLLTRTYLNPLPFVMLMLSLMRAALEQSKGTGSIH